MSSRWSDQCEQWSSVLVRDVDLGRVAETLRTECDCCPFFDLGLDLRRREMTIGVASEEWTPAHDAITLLA